MFCSLVSLLFVILLCIVRCSLFGCWRCCCPSDCSWQDYKSAMRYFDDSLRDCGDHHVTHYNLGLCLYYLGRLPEALSRFDRSLELSRGDYDEAREWQARLRQKLALPPQSALSAQLSAAQAAVDVELNATDSPSRVRELSANGWGGGAGAVSFVSSLFGFGGGSAAQDEDEKSEIGEE